MKWKESNEGVETKAEEEGTFEEDYSPLRRQKLKVGSGLVSVFTKPGSWLVVIPVLLLVVFLFSIRSGGSDKALLSAMDLRIQQLENGMATVEGINELVMDLDKSRQTTDPLMARLDRLEASFVKSISEMEKQLKELQTRVAKSEARQIQPPVVKSQTPKRADRTHVVKKGETLYSIGRQYGLSVNQLMSFNNLSKGAIINPGQSLKVGP